MKFINNELENNDFDNDDDDFNSIRNNILNEEIDDEIDDNELSDSNGENALSKKFLSGESSHEFNDDSDDEDMFSSMPAIWEYRSGVALSETVREYEIFRAYLELGRSRSREYLIRIFNLSKSYLARIADKNGWRERIEAYDRQTMLTALSNEDIAREREHQRKLELYRSQQETLAQQSANAASKMMHLINRKINKLVSDETENLTIDEVVSVGNLTVKLASMQKELGSQALGVDVLLGAIEDNQEEI